MTIEQTKVVDAIGVEIQTGRVVLTIADHLPWSDEAGHLALLQAKLNSYLAFLESGEVFESYPDSKGRQFRIDVVFQHKPGAAADRFLSDARDAVTHAGFALSWRIFRESTPLDGLREESTTPDDGSA